MWCHTHRNQISSFGRNRSSPFKSVWGRQFSRLLAAEVCASAVVMLDTTCFDVVWRVLATHSIHQFPIHFPSRTSPCAITFQLNSTYHFSMNAPNCYVIRTLPILLLYITALLSLRRLADSLSSSDSPRKLNWTAWTMGPVGPIGYPETSITKIDLRCVTPQKRAYLIYAAA